MRCSETASARQSRRASAAEAIANTVAGLALSVAAIAWLFPAFGVVMTMQENVTSTALMTALSFARTYAVRRAFETWGAR